MKAKKDEFLTIEHPNGRTYGECLQDEALSIRMINGQFLHTLHIKDKPKRMKRDQALKYYTHKLRRIWNKKNI